MKLLDYLALNEISQKAGVSRDPLLLKLKILAKQPNVYIHFTNEPNKIGFNPSPQNTNYTFQNPKGFYGFPLPMILQQLEETRHLSHDKEKYIIVFKPKEGLRFYKARENDLPQVGSKFTLKLIKQGYDGVVSDNFALSGDIKSEIVIFRPSNVQVLLVAPNSLVHEMDAQFYQGRLKNAEIDNQKPENIKSAIKRSQNQGRAIRKNSPI